MTDRRPAFGTTDGLLVLMAIIWGVNYSAVKYGTGAFRALPFAWVRLLLAAATVNAMALARRAPWPSRRDAMALVAWGVLGTGVYQLLWVTGVSLSRVADAALIIASAPAFIAIVGRLRGVEAIHPRTILGIALSIGGVGIVILGNTYRPQRAGTLLGTAAILCAVLCWSVYTVSLRQYMARVPVVRVNALTMLGGLIPMCAITPLVWSGTPWRTIAWPAWGAVAYSSVISIGIAYLFWYRGLRVLGPTRTAIYGNLQPVVAIVVAWIALREVPTLWQGAGAGAIVGGVLLTRS